MSQDTQLFGPEYDGQTPLDPDEARGLKLAWVANRSDLNLAEEHNIVRGMAWANRRAGRSPVLTQETLRELHRRMFAQVWSWAGRYRDTERNIGIAPHRISTELQPLLDDARLWQETGVYSIDERAVRLHHRLTHIHPFPNGNGRCSRVFSDMFLTHVGVRQFSWGLGMPPARRRQDYLAALRAADAHDLAALLQFVRR